MIKKIAILISVTVVLLLLFVVLNRSKQEGNNFTAVESTEIAEEVSSNNSVLPWIEVLTDNIFIKTLDGERKLESGDELDNGATISTDSKGFANIYFPDGSVIRLDANTEIKIEVGDYDESDSSLKVKISLVTGRVWSKILELLTQESYWEVETSNAVAAVRGTSFGVEYVDNSTKVVVSENLVSVTVKDLESDNLNNKVLVKRDSYITITPEIVKNLNNKEVDLKQEVKIVSNNLTKSNWVSDSAPTYNKVNVKMKNLKKDGYTDDEIRAIFVVDTANDRLGFVKVHTLNSAQLKSDDAEPQQEEIQIKESSDVKIQPIIKDDNANVDKTTNESGNFSSNTDQSSPDTEPLDTGTDKPSAGLDQPDDSPNQPNTNTDKLGSSIDDTLQSYSPVVSSIVSQPIESPLTITSSTILNIQMPVMTPVLNVVQ